MRPIHEFGLADYSIMVFLFSIVLLYRNKKEINALRNEAMFSTGWAYLPAVCSCIVRATMSTRFYPKEVMLLEVVAVKRLNNYYLNLFSRP